MNSTSKRIPGSLLISVGAVIFLANAGLLVLQLVAGRFLAPFIGSSIETWTSVIGIFLTGIALGNWLGGKVADRFPTPRTVSVLLILGGLSSLGMIACYEWTLASGFYRSLPLAPRIPVLALIFCLPPALFLSLLTPVTIKLTLPDVSSAGRVAGLIFALSTLGCLVGNYFTGFWLMAEFTLNQITQGVGFGLIALAVPMLFIGRASSPLAASPSTSENSDIGDGTINFRGNIRLAYAVVFLSSFCGMSMELTGSRILAPVLGVSLFTWTGIIGVMLAGTCCGNYLGGILADRGVGPALVRFAFILAALAGFTAGPMLLRHYGPEFNASGDPITENAMRLLAAVVAVVLICPGIWLGTRRKGPSCLACLLGGLLGMSLSHTAGRAIDRALDLRGFTAFHEVVSRILNFDAAPLIIHGLGFAFGVTIALLFIWDAPRSSERTTRSGALSGTLLLAGLMTLSILPLIAMCTNFNFMMGEKLIVQKVLIWTFGLFFLPMLLLGAISPQVIRLSVRDTASAGRVAGSIYAWSTVGAIVGTFAAGYFLIASIGTFRVVLVLAFVLTMLAFFVGQLWRQNASLYAASILCGASICGLFIINYGSNRYDLETRYYAIATGYYVEDDRHRVKMVLDMLVHSYVDLEDPTWLGYKHEYVQGELLTVPYLRNRALDKPTNILVIGGGGYTFPRFVQHTMPEVHVDVVEIDPGVTQIAYDKLGLAGPEERAEKGLKAIRSIHMDGRQFVSEQAAKGHYDLVVQDAVNDLSVPYHLMTKEYNDAVKATLAPGGVYLLTLIDSLEDGKLWRAAADTMRQTFKYVYVLGSSPFRDRDGEIIKARGVYILYGSDEPIDAKLIEEQALKHRRELTVPLRALLSQRPGEFEAIREGVDFWCKDGWTRILDSDEMEALLRKRQPLILTDQFCPVDNLMSDVFRDRLKK